MDSVMDLEMHVNSVVRSCYMHLRGIGLIRKFLTEDAAATLVHAFVSSRLDNLNGILCNSYEFLFDKLQKVQNQAARIVTRVKLCQRLPMTPILQELHWLPIRQRITYKICLLAFKCIQGEAPKYLVDIIKLYKPNRPLRSESQILIAENGHPNVGRYGMTAFSICTPKIWNNKLPEDVRNCENLDCFKRKLKTFLFRQAYSDNF